MSKSGKHVERLVTTGRRVVRVEPAAVAAALGGEPTGEGVVGSPPALSLYALRAELMERRHSSGGRPGLEGATNRVKIPLSDADWQKLEEMAASVSAEGFAPSAGQVASVLLAAALRGIAPLPLGERSVGPQAR